MTGQIVAGVISKIDDIGKKVENYEKVHCIGKKLKKNLLLESKKNYVWFSGYSLGAHVCGHYGKTMTTLTKMSKMGRITGNHCFFSFSFPQMWI